MDWLVLFVIITFTFLILCSALCMLYADNLTPIFDQSAILSLAIVRHLGQLVAVVCLLAGLFWTLGVTAWGALGNLWQRSDKLSNRWESFKGGKIYRFAGEFRPLAPDVWKSSVEFISFIPTIFHLLRDGSQSTETTAVLRAQFEQAQQEYLKQLQSRDEELQKSNAKNEALQKEVHFHERRRDEPQSVEAGCGSKPPTPQIVTHFYPLSNNTRHNHSYDELLLSNDRLEAANAHYRDLEDRRIAPLQAQNQTLQAALDSANEKLLAKHGSIAETEDYKALEAKHNEEKFSAKGYKDTLNHISEVLKSAVEYATTNFGGDKFGLTGLDPDSFVRNGKFVCILKAAYDAESDVKAATQEATTKEQKESEEREKALRSELKKYKDSIREKENLISKYEDQIKSGNTQGNNLQQQLHSANSDLEAKKAEVVSATAKIAQLDSEVSALRNTPPPVTNNGQFTQEYLSAHIEKAVGEEKKRSAKDMQTLRQQIQNNKTATPFIFGAPLATSSISQEDYDRALNEVAVAKEARKMTNQTLLDLNNQTEELRRELFKDREAMATTDFIDLVSQHLRFMKNKEKKGLKKLGSQDQEKKIETRHVNSAKEHFNLFTKMLTAACEITNMLKSHNIPIPVWEYTEKPVDWFNKMEGEFSNYYEMSYLSCFQVVRHSGQRLDELQKLVESRVVKRGLLAKQGKAVLEMVNRWDEVLNDCKDWEDKDTPPFS